MCLMALGIGFRKLAFSEREREVLGCMHVQICLGHFGRRVWCNFADSVERFFLWVNSLEGQVSNLCPGRIFVGFLRNPNVVST